MTIARLEQYRAIKRQLEIFESDAGITYIKSVDTTRTPVQSGKTSNPTAVIGLKLFELNGDFKNEYNRLKRELQTLTKYIMQIKNQDVKEMAMRRFIVGQTYEQIGTAMFCDGSTARKKLKRYISHNSH